ncbi:MAG: hypothetical protein D8M57_05170 [Candidatus Scalindua sp. AMX11]|nr:MAG: hypothetical protein DWQ00_07615 [Candidatus Scalindua sp.]NOG85993.1 Rieske 2Fe-2S domain-containing protein [Planctomycetota bacterium]RZV91377.1 MAG: hypothetical protein EX341_05450 [Candidatus Scalindua sp. SCAELEC01]TDE65933.1 MAG: hypothetical protein D8M57_05170 [Candidatus Scalindua sp. AMX11]GJQ59239.1 MAG: hypothetical protein SCALA701_20400 [Candidatus Scalindua sp.]
MKEKLDECGNGRRTFLKACSLFLTSLIGIAYGIPLIRAFINPALQKTVISSSGLVEVGNIQNCKVNVPRKVAIKDSRNDAWTKYPETVIGAVWVVRGEDDKITAFSVICPHLGCGIDWDKDSGRFVCPCHDSYFDIKGGILSGPSPRTMDTLETDIKEGKLFVRYQKMKLGIAEKIPG